MSLENAERLAAFGFNVLPAKRGDRFPIVSWRQYQTERTDSKLRHWFSGAERNYWIATGQISGVAVLDVDSEEAEAYWREQLGDLLDQTARVQTARGIHYYFRLNEPMDSWSLHDEDSGLSFDVRADGGGVIAPPSLHETGILYEWIQTPDEGLVDLPNALRKEAQTGEGEELAQPRSMLSELLAHPPAGENSGRNDWLTKVAGHYAKMIQYRDAYDTLVWQAAHQCDTPLPDEEIHKTADSVWKSERSKGVILEASMETGWLVGNGEAILVSCRNKDGDEWLEPFADFDIRATGVLVDESTSERWYDVVFDEQRDMLPLSKFGSLEALRRWFAGHGCNLIGVPAGKAKGHGDTVARLFAYLKAQNPPEQEAARHIGWVEDQFLTHEGVITVEGEEPHQDKRPLPELKNKAPFTYGFTSHEDASAVLREVMAFHDNEVCAVFGAWWTACLLKGHIMQSADHFPFLALEAPSGTGKSTGFFSLMMELAGNHQGQTVPTTAVFRDMVAAHRNGVAWIDDTDEPQRVFEIIRAATSEATLEKMAEDRTTSRHFRMVAPILLSGEALQIGTQKALLDRSIRLEVPDPTQFRSVKDPNRLQWDDIVELRQREDSLTRHAGSIVQMALSQEGKIDELRDLRPESGRRGDVLAVLRVGARVLAAMMGEDWVIAVVDRWCQRSSDTSRNDENALTLQVIPDALRTLDYPVDAGGPVVVKDELVYFNVPLLADWYWQRYKGQVQARVHSEKALTDQVRQLGLSLKGDKARLGARNYSRTVYWRLGAEHSRLVLARAAGGDVGGQEAMT